MRLTGKVGERTANKNFSIPLQGQRIDIGTGTGIEIYIDRSISIQSTQKFARETTKDVKVPSDYNSAVCLQCHGPHGASRIRIKRVIQSSVQIQSANTIPDLT